MNFNSKSRRSSIKVWVSPEEKELLEQKAKLYGYKKKSDYVRDAVIYEKVTYVDLKNKNFIYDIYSKNTKEIRSIKKSIRYIAQFATQIDEKTRKELLFKLSIITKKQNQILNMIEEKLDLKVWNQINRRIKKNYK